MVIPVHYCTITYLCGVRLMWSLLKEMGVTRNLR
jgi:hypothetical protein